MVLILFDLVAFVALLGSGCDDVYYLGHTGTVCTQDITTNSQSCDSTPFVWSTGLALHPLTNEFYLLGGLSSTTPRSLINFHLDYTNDDYTIIKTYSSSLHFAGITFGPCDSSNNNDAFLYSITGCADSTSSITIVKIDITTGNYENVVSIATDHLNNGNKGGCWGRVLTYSPYDDYLYTMTYTNSDIYNILQIDRITGDYTITSMMDINNPGWPDNEYTGYFHALAIYDENRLLVTSGEILILLNISNGYETMNPTAIEPLGTSVRSNHWPVGIVCQDLNDNINFPNSCYDSPSFNPSPNPTPNPTPNPSQDPSGYPSQDPSGHPTSNPSPNPTSTPTTTTSTSSTTSTTQLDPVTSYIDVLSTMTSDTTSTMASSTSRTLTSRFTSTLAGIFE